MAEEQVTAMEERLTGRVAKFNDMRGFGFIKPDGGGEDLFVHHSAISSEGGYRTLSNGDVVEFSVAFSDNKYQAVDVTAPGGGTLLPSRRTSGGDGFSTRRSGSAFGSSWNSRRSNGGGYGSGGAGCYSCGSRDHLARNCDKGNYNNSGGGGGGGGGVGGCFNCGDTGHFARDCNRSGNVGGGYGGGVGGGGGGGACFNCGRHGHMARDCAGGGGSGGCYNCGGYGHLARECSSARVGERFGGGEGGSGGCFNCGQAGHFARECPSNA